MAGRRRGRTRSGRGYERRKLSLEPLEVRTLLAVLAGDYNADEVVDAADYAVWRDNVGAPAGTLPNDVDGGVIGDAQYATWKRNFGTAARAARQFEYLDRGLVATRLSSTQVFVSWRLMADDPAGIAFNLYRSTGDGAPVKVNDAPLAAGTNFTDTVGTSNLNQFANRYFVRPIVEGVEQGDSDSNTLAANSPTGPYFTVSMRNIGNYDIRHVSVGDLDGDGAYDYVVARRPPNASEVAVGSQLIEAYRSDGTFLWVVDCGSNSLDVDNIEPGPSTVDIGNWDGIQVYDLDGDGKAEVLYRSANGVTFGDGSTLSHGGNNDIQFISVIDGITGAERSRVQIPTDFLADGPLAAMTGIGYLDGVHPSLVVKMKNRVGSGSFNMMIVAYDFDGQNITQKWKWVRNIGVSDGHNIRIADVDQDGKDEVCDIGFVLNGDGTLKYELASQGVIHGDRFYIGDFDPGRPGLEGYGIQQDNPLMLMEYYYDASTGEILHTTFGTTVGDNGRGEIGDVDPTRAGFEYWSFFGMFNSNTPVEGQPPVKTLVDPTAPSPGVSLYWDGDLLTETLSTDQASIDQWNQASQTSSRVITLYNLGSGAVTQDGYPIYFGDVIGDWREEVIYERNDRQALVVFTSQVSSTNRLYTLAQNPLYRNSMTLKGYLQSRNLDYYLGSGMSTPPTPNIEARAPNNDGNAKPTVAESAAASSTTVTGTTTNLSVLGADDEGENNLTYTWWSTGGGDGVTFSTNATNNAKNTAATFHAAGTYNLVVTIRDGEGMTTTSKVVVTVNQTLARVDVTPPGAVIAPGASQQFAAIGYDQFDRTMTSQPTFTWSVIEGAGTVNSTGRYTAPGTAGVATIQATAGGFSDTASVTTSSNTTLRGWWKMDESGGSQVVDSSGFAQHGNAVNGPTFVAGKSGNVLSFDGSNDYVDLPVSIANSSAGSVSMWFKTGANFTDQAFLFYISPVSGGNGLGAEQELHINFNASERLHFYIKDAANGVNDINLTSASAYANNAWHHVAATWDINGNAVLYVDGAAVGSAAHDAASFGGSSVVRLGRPGASTRYYNGQMDDVRLYNVAISAADVLDLFNQGGGGALSMDTGASGAGSAESFDAAFAGFDESARQPSTSESVKPAVAGAGKHRTPVRMMDDGLLETITNGRTKRPTDRLQFWEDTSHRFVQDVDFTEGDASTMGTNPWAPGLNRSRLK